MRERYERSMQKVKFLNTGKKRECGLFDFSQLKNTGVTSSQTDIRFALFSRDKEEVYAVLFDIDKCPYINGLSLMDKICDMIGEYKLFHVFTGNGHHIYLPLQTPVPFDAILNYRASYLELLEDLSDEYDGRFKFDKQPFAKMVYGRVPGALNGKNQTEVRYVGETDYPVMECIDDFLEYREMPPKMKVVASDQEGVWNPAKFCGVIDYVKRHGKEVTYDIWNMAMCTLAAVNDLPTALAINQKKPESDVRSFFTKSQKYHYSCMNVPMVFQGIPDCPCYNCPHHLPNCSPAFVSGKLPTPHASTGFYRPHANTKDKEVIINYDFINVQGVVNHWINMHKDIVLRSGKTLYIWTGSYWHKKGELIPSDRMFPDEVLHDLQRSCPEEYLKRHPS